MRRFLRFIGITRDGAKPTRSDLVIALVAALAAAAVILLVL